MVPALRQIPATTLRLLPRPMAGAAAGLLSQLPDFVAGTKALEAGRLAEAQLPLERAVEVAEAYFPPSAARERAHCHAALGRCLWRRGRMLEAAAQYEAGLRVTRDHPSVEVPSCMAFSASRMYFELGRFSMAESLAAEAAQLDAQSEAARLMVEAVQAVEGHVPAGTAELADTSLEAVRRSSRLTAAVLKDSGEVDGDALEAELADGRPLAQLLAAEGAPSLPLLAARSTAGQLAVAAGRGGEPWARALLVKALDDFEALQPATSPTFTPLLFQNLGALGTLTGLSSGEHIAAEGLFISAVDHIDKAMHGYLADVLTGPRGRIWRARVFYGFADLLEQGRRAEQRRSEIVALRGRAANALGSDDGEAPQISSRQVRWALVHAPQPEPLKVLDHST